MTQPMTDQSTGVIVLGPYRSGTSLTCKVLSCLGVDFGPRGQMYGPNRYNPGGYFERSDVNKCNTRFIESANSTLATPGDPFDIAASGDGSILTAVDFSWTRDRRLWGIKDPRLAVTLPAWFEQGLLDPDRTRLILVTRQIEPTVRSALKHPHVRDYCDGTEEGVRSMIERYATLAREIVRHYATIPAIEFSYEELIEDPAKAVEKLAAFLGVTDPRAIQKAIQIVGKKRAKLRHFVTFALAIAPAKIWRRLRR